MIKLNDLAKGMKLKLTKNIKGISYSKGDVVEVYDIENDKVLLKFGIALGVFNIREINEYFIFIDSKQTFKLECYRTDYIDIEDGTMSDKKEIYEFCNELKNTKPTKLTYEFKIVGDKTTCKIFEGDILIGRSLAKLHKDDTYSIKIGLEVAKLKAEIDIKNRRLETIYTKLDINDTDCDNWLNNF